MLRRSFTLMGLICFLWAASTGYGLVIDDFEEETIRPVWRVNNWDSPPGTISPNDVIGVTSGAQSMKLEVPRAGWTIAALVTFVHNSNPDLYDNEEFIPIYQSHQTIEMDITIDPNDWVGNPDQDQWVNIIGVMNSQTGGWVQDLPLADDVNPDFPGGWDPENFPTQQTRHVAWDITDTHEALANGGGGWWEFFIIINSGGFPNGGTIYVDNVQLVSTTEASSPSPPDNATETEVLPILSWKAGLSAASHTLYLGTDINDVNEATLESHDNVIMINTDVAGYAVQDFLAFESTFYWRVDEVNDTSVWKGPVWTFTTGNFEVIDNFEFYNDDRNDPAPNRIFEVWVDSYDSATDSFPGSQVGNFDPPYAEQNIVFTGSQSMPFLYNNDGEPFYSEALRAFASPQDWITAHDGQSFESLGLHIHGRWESPGTFSYDQATGQYTVIGSGTDIWNAEDQFHYVLQPLDGDGSIVAKVESVENTDAWAKAGVMIREGLASDTAMFGVIVAPSERTQFLYRDLPGENAIGEETGAGSIALPYWVKITRQGAVLQAQHSADGQTWLDFSQGTLALSLFGDVYIGLVVTSHVDAGTPCEAVFSNVTVTGTASPVFTESTDTLDMPTNVSDNLYVAVEDNNGGIAMVNHPDDPNAILVNDWQQWRIDLADLSDRGLDLTQITSMTLGIGDKSNPTPRGIGKLFVDDIRLYLPVPDEPNNP